MESTKIERCNAIIHRKGQENLTCRLQPNHPKAKDGSDGHVFELDATDTAQFNRGRLLGIEEGRDAGQQDALEALDRCIRDAGEPTRSTLVSARGFVLEWLTKRTRAG